MTEAALQTPPPVEVPTAPAKPIKPAIALVLTLSRFGVSRKVSSSAVETDANKNLLSLTKRILRCDEYNAITARDSRTRNRLKELAISNLYKPGIYLLPVALMKEVDDFLQAAQTERDVLVDRFLAVYIEKKNSTMSELGSLANERDYPAPEGVRCQFGMSYEFQAVAGASVPTDVKEAISADAFEREQKKAADRWQQFLDSGKEMMRVHWLDVCETFLERMTPDASGKEKRFRPETVEKVEEFFRTFNARNITNDAKLEDLVQKAALIMKGVTPALLREDSTVRATVAQTFAAVKIETEALVSTKVREIQLDD